MFSVYKGLTILFLSVGIITLFSYQDLGTKKSKSEKQVTRKPPRLKLSDVKENKIFTVEKMRKIHEKGMSVFKDRPMVLTTGYGDVARVIVNIEKKLKKAIDFVLFRTKELKEYMSRRVITNSWKLNHGRLKKVNSRVLDISSRRLSENGKMENVVVYNRVPKSGSTTMITFIFQLRKKNAFLAVLNPTGAYRSPSGTDQRSLGLYFSEANKRARTMFIRHQYFINFTQSNMDQPKYINVMRDPIDFFLSNYMFKRTQMAMRIPVRDMTEGAKNLMTMSFEKCVLQNRFECSYKGKRISRGKEYLHRRWIDNVFMPNDQMLYFCGTDPECAQLGNPKALAKAKYNVENHFVVVGLLEYMNESVTVFENKLPTWFRGMSKLYTDSRVENSNSVKKGMVLNVGVRKVLKERYKDLYELYGFIKQKLFRQYRQATKNNSPPH